VNDKPSGKIFTSNLKATIAAAEAGVATEVFI
jgi:hypothetical protein